MTPVDGEGRGPTTRALFLPAGGIARLRQALARDEALGRALLQWSAAQQADETTPDSIDREHNTRRDSLARVVPPSRLNGRNPVQTQVQFSFRFLNFDPNGDVYIVPGGDVLESRVTARARAAGHWHGDSSRRAAAAPARRQIGTADGHLHRFVRPDLDDA